MKGGKKLKTKMENNFWKTFSIILIVVLVVGAVIVFWRNPELSPNAGVIKVQQSKYGPEVYTKAEVDAILSSVKSSANSQILCLMHSPLAIRSGEEITLGQHTISVIVSSSTAVGFTVDGKNMDTMNVGDIEKVYGTNNDYIGVTNIVYQSYVGGLKEVSFNTNFC